MHQKSNTNNRVKITLDAYKNIDQTEHSVRYRWGYITGKIRSDYELLSKIELSNKRVLNIGCREPIDEIQFARIVKKWTTLDFSREVIKFARKQVDEELSSTLANKIEFVLGDARHPPFNSESFDIVVAFSTIEHIPGRENRVSAIKEISRVTRKGGYVVITVPNKLSIRWYIRNLIQQRSENPPYGYEYYYTPW